MAFMSIRGAQIKSGSITNSHIDPITIPYVFGVEPGAGGLFETVLQIDWASHHGDILDQKIIIDRVQKNGISVGVAGTNTVTVTLPGTPSVDQGSGIILYGSAPDNVNIKIRNSVNGEPFHSDGTLQIETAPVSITGTVVAGTITVTVTGTGIGNSPKSIELEVADADSAIDIAGKIRTALGVADITNNFTVGGTNANVTLTAKNFAVNDTNLNIAIVDTDSTGVNALVSSTNTQAGSIESASEVYGRLVSESSGDYVLNFYSDAIAPGTAYILPANTSIDILYPQRFTLHDIPENFLENERFVDGAVDVSAYLNLQQMTYDIFGNNYTLDNDGKFQNWFTDGLTLVEEMVKITSGVTNTTVRASTIIDEVVAARGSMDSLDERLDVSLNEDGTLKIGSAIHDHVYMDQTMIADEVTEVIFELPATTELNTPKTSDTYNVYINGIKNTVGTGKQCTIVVSDGDTVTVTIDDNLEIDDIVELEAIIFGVDD